QMSNPSLGRRHRDLEAHPFHRRPAWPRLSIPPVTFIGWYAAEAVVQQEAGHHIVETRHQGPNRRYHCEKGFR
ncbi:MAG: hypothetical protein ACP5FQ_08060, partial [Thermoplasmata archaeon]